MAKQKKKKEAKQQSEKSAAERNEEDSAPANNSFDFGGLPARDLKKNLGCGG
jgi:hypothetical protein